MSRHSTLSRRHFLHLGTLLAGGTLLLPSQLLAGRGPGPRRKAPVILITSGWQDINIGDIAHTPGLIALLKKRIPDAKIILWKRSPSQKVEDMLGRYYPDVRIVHGQVDAAFVPQTEAVKQAFGEADVFIHGSGPFVLAADYLEAWHRQTKKPFGIFGVTIQDVSPELKALLQHATFIFTRETASVEVLRKAGLAGKHIGFAPDATFALTIRNDALAQAFMQANQLKRQQFICVIPRLRLTPYHKLKPNNNGWSAEKIKQVEDLNNQFKEVDHAKLREAMIAWVRKTGKRIVVCPEMTYQVDIMDELLITPLPDDVKPFVVKHDYWLPDEANSLYANAHTVLSFECHSPIMAATTGTPCFYLRQPEDTIKGQMYYDLGFGDWTFEIDRVSGAQIAAKLLDVAAHYAEARQSVRTALTTVARRYDEAFRVVSAAV